MKNKIRSFKIVIIVLLLIILIAGIPLFINYLFKQKTNIEILIPEWSAGDTLAYYGCIISSTISIIGVFLTIKYAQKNYTEDTRNKALPFLSLDNLNKKIINPLNEIINSNEGSEIVEIQKYYEEKLEKIYFIIENGTISVKDSLSPKQKKLIEQGGNIWINGDEGEKILKNIPTLATPIRVENVGNGAAINVRVGFNNLDLKPDERKYIRPLNLKVEDSLYLNIFCEDIKEKDTGKYILEFKYEDIYNNKYIQSYNTFIQHSSNKHSNYEFVIVIESNQKKIN